MVTVMGKLWIYRLHFSGVWGALFKILTFNVKPCPFTPSPLMLISINEITDYLIIFPKHLCLLQVTPNS